ncbi:MAG TPA: pitrilysin family protein [Candidatus Krumholzibacteria bacterium]|nr:pitrilysin family protein [Candidatus Krumholzibacteria bacterium]
MNLDPYRNELPPRRDVLPGGAVLLSVPVPGSHAVTFGVWLRSGSQDEPAGLGGISHFLEHMVFKGSTTRSALEIATVFDSLGATVDAFTTKDLVAFTVKVLPEYFTPAAEVLADMLLRPAFDPALTALEQDVVIEEIQEALDTPEDRLHDAFAARLYGGHARGRPILGFPEAVRSFEADVLHREHRRLFAGTNLVVAVAGDNPALYTDTLARLFADLPAPSPVPVVAEPAPRAAAIVDGDLDDIDPFRLELSSPIIQTYFEFGNLAVPYAHPDRIPIFLLSNLLGGGMSSRVFQAVREREGLAYSVYTYSDMGRDIGLVSCAGSCSPDKMARLEDVVRREYALLLKTGLATDELRNNQAQIKSQLIFSLEGVLNQMHRAARNEIYYGRFVPVAELVDEVDGVDEATIMRCARSWFDPDAMLVATHGPAPGAALEEDDEDGDVFGDFDE